MTSSRHRFSPEPLALRLNVTSLRDKALPTSAGNEFVFGALMSGCPVSYSAFWPGAGDNSTVAYESAGNGSTPALLSFPGGLVADGYYVRVLSGPAAADPVSWSLEAFSEDGQGGGGWRPVGASVWMSFGFEPELYPNLAYPMPTERGVRVDFDLRTTWAWYLGDPVSCLVTSFEWLGFAVLGMAGRPVAAKYLLLGSMLVVALVIFGGAVGYAMAGSYRDSIFLWLCGCPILLFSTSGMVERWSLAVIGLYGLANIFSNIIRIFVLYEYSAASVNYMLSNSGTVAVAFFLGYYAMRRWALRNARLLVLQDKTKYDAVWAQIMADPGDRSAVEELKGLADALKLRASNEPRQRSRRRAEQSVQRTPSLRFPARLIPREPQMPVEWPGITSEPGAPLTSLDQLYHQALVVDPLLRAKTLAWASGSGGFLARRPAHDEPVLMPDVPSLNNVFSRTMSFSRVPLRLPSDDTSSGYVRAAEMDAGMAEVHVKWCRLKNVKRMFEKLARSYNEDVSQLVDVCRQSIYFRSVLELRDCLDTMARDPDVVIERVKNRLDPSYNATETAGYRNVSLNLRLVDDRTRSLGVETHVCELQLLLIAMADIKNVMGHQRYITFRNLRGE